MKRATLALVAAFAAIFATAETNRTATENWTRNRIGEATNATLQAAKEYAADAAAGKADEITQWLFESPPGYDCKIERGGAYDDLVIWELWGRPYDDDGHYGDWGKLDEAYEGNEPLELTFSEYGVTATRKRVLYTGDAPTPADVTAAIREQSLGGIWDESLQVWWTPRMRNGILTYEATTNVNLNAEN